MSGANYTEQIYSWIDNSTFEDRELLAKLQEDRDSQYSLYRIIDDNTKSLYPEDFEGAYEIFIDSVSDYLFSYPTSYSGKKRLSKKLKELCEDIGKQYRIKDYKSSLDALVFPVEDDIALEIIKDLHSRDGVTKDELHDRYHVSERTIQGYIHRISGEDRHNPVRIGGQAVRVPVTQIRNHRDESARYMTKNTMSPIVLQLNVSQTYYVLKSLQLSFDNGNNIPLDLAIEVWSQLTDYLKERIQSFFGSRDPDFNSFLDLLESENDNYIRRFKSEDEMFCIDDLTVQDQLLMAIKAGGQYNLILENPRSYLENQLVFYESQSGLYYACSDKTADGKKSYFTINDLLSINKV